MFEQIKLTYNYNGLEPVIDALTVETHYAKHHAAYAKNFNDAAEKAGVADMVFSMIFVTVRSSFCRDRLPSFSKYQILTSSPPPWEFVPLKV